MAVTDEQVQAVLAALENPDYEWRTLGGVSKDTGLGAEEVLEAIGTSADKVVKSPTTSADGQDLYTTRDQLSKNTSFAQKMLGAVKNRAM